MARSPKRYPPADLSDVKRYSISRRKNRSSIVDLGKPLSGSVQAERFLASLPKFLKAADLNAFVDAIIKARSKDKPFHIMLGAHVIKVGLSPILIDLMKRRLVTGLSFNGAGLIHELELAFFGGTSEDVQAGLSDGSFGMVKETGQLYARVCEVAESRQLGLGEAGGWFIRNEKAPYRKHSLFATAVQLKLPVTVHVGIGTDIVCQHPEYDAAQVADASHLDFRILASVCGDLDRGGVVANIGSAVMLPEVFLKALTVARNLKKGKSRLTTANFDMIEHYRPRVNVVTRPTLGAGKGYSFIGHHEIMIPLLAWALKSRKIG
ncbi:MAG: hypothetical protein J7J98_01775 [candidate division Zixibacteria bacterium]|nr:hypothetical protein [candidate division Zixibacteria bacterium]